MKKILTVATYPISNPQHGGQKRLSALVTAYREVGHDVLSVGVFDKGVYRQDYSKSDIQLGEKSSREARSHPWTSDIICGRAVVDDEEVKRQMSTRLIAYRPDIIHFEQPFMYLGLKSLMRELGISPMIIFGSQNIEGPMKRDILEGQFVPQSEVEEAVATIECAEKELALDADIVLACTDHDAGVYRKLGVKPSKIVVAPNGINPLTIAQADREYWQDILEKEGIKNKILFVASAHPPSITGFVEMVGKGLGFLGVHDRIMVAGSVSDYFKDVFKETNLDIGDVTMWLRIRACGRLSESRLGALISLADIIILPITEGGGSNLKTAEALMANKKVIATTHALRSFEWARKFPNIWVADTSSEYRRAIQSALTAEIQPRTAEQQKIVDGVLWTNQLHDFKERMQGL